MSNKFEILGIDRDAANDSASVHGQWMGLPLEARIPHSSATDTLLQDKISDWLRLNPPAKYQTIVNIPGSHFRSNF